jgi:hypothetical protein
MRNNPMRNLFILLFFALAACTKSASWPDHGAGGYGKYQYLEDGQIETLMRRLRLAEACGARRFAALEFQDAEIAAVYLRRAHVAQDRFVAQIEYEKLTMLVHKIEQRVKIDGCRVQ